MGLLWVRRDRLMELKHRFNPLNPINTHFLTNIITPQKHIGIEDATSCETPYKHPCKARARSLVPHQYAPQRGSKFTLSHPHHPSHHHHVVSLWRGKVRTSLKILLFYISKYSLQAHKHEDYNQKHKDRMIPSQLQGGLD